MDSQTNNNLRKAKKVDAAIIDFFNKGFCFLYNGRTNLKKAHDILFFMFISRLEQEHEGEECSFEYGKFDGVFCYKITKNQHNEY